MQCSTCRFENLPGENACARCGAALSARGGLIVDYLPPRAGGRKAWYPLLYRVNAAVDGYRDWYAWRAVSALAGVPSLPPADVLRTGLSVLPGLGHWSAGRRRGAAVAFFVWLGLGMIAVNAFGSAFTGATIGLLVGWHAVVMFDAGLRRHISAVRRRWLLMAITLVAVAAPYMALHRMVYLSFDFVRVPCDHAACDLEEDDRVLVKRGTYGMDDLAEGDVVAFVSTENGQTTARPGLVLRLDTQGAVVGRIAALGGDRVEVSSAGLRRLSGLETTVAAPEPGLPAPREAFTFEVPPGHALIPVAIRLPRGEIEDTAVRDIWTKMFTVEPGDVRGRALLVYQPVWRRRFIRGN